ncbi:MAG: hypothetical protein ABI285_09085 [Ginsengibacter sp.]
MAGRVLPGFSAISRDKDLDKNKCFVIAWLNVKRPAKNHYDSLFETEFVSADTPSTKRRHLCLVGP